jgi:hypothetical protein
MLTVKNPIETAFGSIKCEVLNNGVWDVFIMSKNDEYVIHEDSQWKDIKPCDQAEKDTYLRQQEKDSLLSDLAALDLPAYTIERALTGDQYAIQLINENENKKALIRAKLK